MNKITHIKLFLYCHNDCHPFAAIHKGPKRIKFYDLTNATAWRLAHAIPYGVGSYTIDGQGWSWTRKEASPHATVSR